MTADPHAPPPVATLVARHDSGAPRRYPALGAGLVGGFAVLSVVLTLLHGRGPIASTFAPQSEEVDATANDLKALPRAAQRSLVLIGRHAHK